MYLLSYLCTLKWFADGRFPMVDCPNAKRVSTCFEWSRRHHSIAPLGAWQPSCREVQLRKSAQHLVVRVWPPPKLVQWCVDFLSRELSSGARVGLPRYDSWEPMLPTCGSYRRNCYFSVHVMLRCSMYTPRAPGDFAFSVNAFVFLP